MVHDWWTQTSIGLGAETCSIRQAVRREGNKEEKKSGCTMYWLCFIRKLSRVTHDGCRPRPKTGIPFCFAFRLLDMNFEFKYCCSEIISSGCFVGRLLSLLPPPLHVGFWICNFIFIVTSRFFGLFQEIKEIREKKRGFARKTGDGGWWRRRLLCVPPWIISMHF